MRNKALGKGDKATISGDPQDMGLNERSSQSNSEKLRGISTDAGQRPTITKTSVSSDRGKFKCK